MIFSKRLKEHNPLSKLYYKLVGYRTRYEYWSCSDVAKKIQQVHGIPKKPSAASPQEWREWEEAARKASPVGLWITEEGLGILQDIVYFIPDIYENMRIKLKNAFITKSYMIDTKLTRTQWHECNTRIEHGLFNLLVEFVENEKAHMYNNSRESNEKRIDDKRIAGLRYIDWEIGLGDESPLQATAAKEIKEIYIWIKDIYPNRPDVYDVTGWSEYCDNKEFIIDHDESKEARQHVRAMLTEIADLEQLYRDEDTDYLTRIVKAREGMWT